MTKAKKQHVETPPETSQEDVETFQQKVETELKHNVETPTETEKDAVDAVSPSILNDMVCLRVNEGLSLREISKRTKLSLSMVARILKGVETNLASSETEPYPIDGDETTAVSHPSAASSPSTPEPEQLSVRQSSPSNLLDKLAYYQKIPAKDAIMQLVKENSMLTDQMNRNNGHGSPNTSYPNAENPFVTRLMQLAEARDVKDALGLGKNDHEDNELSRRLDRIENKLDNSKQGSELLQVAKALTELARPKGEGRDPIAYVLAGNQMRSDIEKNVQGQYSVGVAKSEIDLKLQEMQQSERLDYKKLDFDVMKWQQEQAKTDKYIELGKSLIEGPLGKLISGVGEGAKNRIEGGPRLPMVTVPCPQCHNKFKANPELLTVSCPFCGSSLQKQPSQPPPTQVEQPSDEPQAQEPQAETVPSEEPKEQKPEIDITSDVAEVKNA
jgi:hypothetical protein